MKNYFSLINKNISSRFKQKKKLDFFSKFIREGELCFDVGAHKGELTEIFLKIGAKVIAVDPQDDCIDYMRRKFRREPNLVLVNKGLSNKEENLTLYICEDSSTISTFSKKWKRGRFSSYQWNTNKLVQTTTLDNLIEKFGLPVFCKIDVEGFEYTVLQGLSKPIPCVSFEFTKEFLDDAKSCINYLHKLGYGIYNCSLGEHYSLLFKEWVSHKELYNIPELETDPLLWGDIYAKFTN